MKNYPHKHLLGTENLTSNEITYLLDLSAKFKNLFLKSKRLSTLEGKTVFNLFLEPSTRTRVSFEMAAIQLGADIINFDKGTMSSVKGETLFDTAKNLEAMRPDLIIVRLESAGAPELLSKMIQIPIINAGDGFHEHPSQALLDLFTIRELKGALKGLKVAIVGDIAHSRVARSNIYALSKMGAKIIVCGPPTMIPPQVRRFHVDVSFDLEKAISGVDVIMMLRIQKERQDSLQFPSLSEYSRYFGLNATTIKNLKKDAIIMHPGPINRGVEITPEIADGPYSVILNQVTNGVAVRMALLHVFGKGCDFKELL